MAFPTVQTADTQNGTQASNSASWTLTYPTNLSSGDLILAFVGCDGTNAAGASAWPADWGFSYENSAANTLHVANKISTGAETGTFTFAPGGSEQGGWRIFRITGWYGSGIVTGRPDLNWPGGFQLNQDGITWGPSLGGSDNAPDPPSCNPANWDVEDTLWIAVCSADTSRTISNYPLPDLNTADVSGGSTGATLGVCMDDLAQASLDSGTFTISANDDWVAATIAIRPAATVYVPRHGFVNYQDPGVFAVEQPRPARERIWLPRLWTPRPKVALA